MRRTHCISALLVAGAMALSTQGADLTKIERTIAKEPAYKGKPKYCLLVFGPEAKTRVWLVQDGDVLYVDRNGNGDLTEKDENYRAQAPQDEIARKAGYEPADGYRVWQVGGFLESDVKTERTNLEVSSSRKGYCIEVISSWKGGRRGQYVVYGNEPLRFADRPQDAPVVHFSGPLGVFLRGPQTLTRGTTAALWAALGTQGLGKGTFAIIFDNKLYNETELIGEIEFPAKVEGARPIKLKIAFRRY